MSRFRNRRVSIYEKLGWLLVLAAAVSALLFWGLNRAVGGWIDRFAWDETYLSQEDGRRLDALQSYVQKKDVSLGDTEKLTAWVRSQAVVSIQVYRNGILCYDSARSGDEPGGWRDEPIWDGLRTITFSDGPAQVLLYGFYAYQFQNWALTGELILSFLLFLCIVMAGIRRSIRYIHALSQEVKILEGGGLECPITISGRDELSELAQGLDAMRRSFLAQNEQEKHLAQASQRMITEMSHDLRTPLTSIMLYTEILLSRKYQGEKQMMDYIEKIDKKARRLKHLSDHLFEYALVTGEDQVELEGPALFQSVFFDTLSETTAYLEQQGFSVELDFTWEDCSICFNREYVVRVFDNLTSNVVKYADRSSPVRICSIYDQDLAGIEIENRKALLEKPPESTKIGLHNIRGMMEKMNGRCQVEESEEKFRLILLFTQTSSQN